MGEKEWTPETVFDVVGDPLARRILVSASGEPLSAEDLADRADASLPSVYRRVNALCEYDLVTERTLMDEDGNRYRTFETTADRLAIDVGEDGLDVEVGRRRGLVDQFDAFWADLDRSLPRGDVEADDRSVHGRNGEDTPHG